MNINIYQEFLYIIFQRKSANVGENISEIERKEARVESTYIHI